MKVVGTLAAIALAVLLVLMVVEVPEPAPASRAGTPWRVAGKLLDGLGTKFVVMEPSSAQSRSAYDDAVAALCRDVAVCTVAFFLPGDRIPETQTAKRFFEAGGFQNYPVLAMWWGNRNTGSMNYTKWDCMRAGRQGAPASALCGG